MKASTSTRISSPLHSPFFSNPFSTQPPPSLTSILLDCTNYALNRAADISFKTIQLSKPHSQKKQISGKPKLLPTVLLIAQVLQAARSSPSSTPHDIQVALSAKSSSNSALRATIRSTNSQEARQRDELLHTVLSSDPSKLQAAVRKSKSVGVPSVHLLQVGKNTYTGDSVADGFYEALS